MLNSIELIELENGKSQIIIQPNNQQDVTVYYGTSPDKQIDTKTKLGVFQIDAILFDTPVSNNRLYYVCEVDGDHYVVAARKIPLEGTFNTRDFGGYIGHEGKMVKWGVFYRSDALHKLTEQDVATLKKLNLRTVVDFRGEGELEKEPDVIIADVTYVNLPPHAAVAQLASGNINNDKAKVEELVRLADTEEGRKTLLERNDDMSQQMRDLVSQEIANEKYSIYLDMLLDVANTPILHHCKGGKDRAGFAAVVALMALGVSKEQIMKDYMLTKEFMAARNVRRMNEYKQFTENQFVLDYLSSLMQTQERYLEAAFDEISKISGSFDQYLIDRLGMTEEKLSVLRKQYLY